MIKNVAPLTVTRADWKNEMKFKSIAAFAKFCDEKYMDVVNYINGKSKGNTNLQQYTVLRDKEKMQRNAIKNKINKRNSRKCGVLCTTTGKKYASITEVAKKLKVNSWTMGLKMEKAGKFISADGREFVRLRPMESKNLSVYPEQSAEIQRTFSRKANKISKVKVQPSTSVVTPVATTVNTNLNASETLKNLAKTFVEQNKFEEAISLLQVAEKLNK